MRTWIECSTNEESIWIWGKHASVSVGKGRGRDILVPPPTYLCESGATQLSSECLALIHWSSPRLFLLGFERWAARGSAQLILPLIPVPLIDPMWTNLCANVRTVQYGEGGPPPTSWLRPLSWELNPTAGRCQSERLCGGAQMLHRDATLVVMCTPS